MCSRKDDGMLAISVISAHISIAAGGTYVLPQRAGRVRLHITMQSAAFLELWSNDSTNGTPIGYVYGGAPQQLFDINHIGRIITGQLVLRNPGGSAVSCDVAEHIESLI